MTELKDEVHEECSKFGEVEKVTVFPKHREGPIIVKFKPGPGPRACIDRMNGRKFDGHIIDCDYWDGTTNYAMYVCVCVCDGGVVAFPSHKRGVRACCGAARRPRRRKQRDWTRLVIGLSKVAMMVTTTLL